jgi:hypothetical protein
MLGVAITIFFCLCMVGFGRVLYGRWMAKLDPAAEVGIAGILGLGTVGLLTLPIGLLPGGLKWGMILVLAMAASGFWNLLKGRIWTRALFPVKPKGVQWLLVLVIVCCFCIALISDLAPSTSVDWDTLAYHLAVPKLWLQAGRIYPITFIHHSNFPFSVDNLYIWGLTWGDQQGAKAFQLCFLALGVLSVFGLTRQRYGGRAGAWAAVGFATVPVVLWEAGTAYIDVAHGLFAGLGIVLAVMALEEAQAEHDEPEGYRPLWPLAGALLGFAAGSKYTGLQAIIAAALVLGLYALVKKQRLGLTRIAALCAIAAAIGAPWYVKNIAWVSNPVYPFFYERFGGKNWSQYNADIYREQQQIFGVPREGPAAGLAALPHAVLGLAYAPGRYTDPSPKLVVEKGRASGAQGNPLQAIGGAVMVAGLFWLFSGRTRRFEGLVLAWMGISLLMWFVLSQQSRYIISFVPPLALLLGGAVVRFRAGPVLAAITSLQALFTMWIFYASGLPQKVRLIDGQDSPDIYLQRALPFYRASSFMNDQLKGAKVALFDEVHGFLLDIPYFWANPGHSTEIGYDRLNNGQEFADRLREMGFTHVYVSVAFELPVNRERIRQVLGFHELTPYSEAEKRALVGNPGLKFKWLLGDAVARDEIAPMQDFATGYILRIRR